MKIDELLNRIKSDEEMETLLEALKVSIPDIKITQISENAINGVGRINEELVHKTNVLFDDSLSAAYQDDEDSAMYRECHSCEWRTRAFCRCCNWLKFVSLILEEHYTKAYPEYEFRIGLEWEQEYDVWFEFWKKDTNN